MQYNPIESFQKTLSMYTQPESDDMMDPLKKKRPRFTIVGPGFSSTGKEQVASVLYNTKKLLTTLSTLSHSQHYPIWLDIQCKPEKFRQIARHIRPHVHPLTIEDCTSPDCREKLEHFDDVLLFYFYFYFFFLCVLVVIF